MVTTFYTVISVLFVGPCFSALDCVDLMSKCAVKYGSNKRGSTSIDEVLRFSQLILSCIMLIGDILSFRDAG